MPLPEKLLREISWDYNGLASAADSILESDGLTDEKISLYRKLLMSVRWYDLRSILTPGQLKEALDDQVQKTLWPVSIKQRYAYAADVLSR